MWKSGILAAICGLMLVGLANASITVTGTGKVKVQAQGKRHGMIKRTTKFVRNARGTMVLCDSDARIVKKYMPYAR